MRFIQVGVGGFGKCWLDVMKRQTKARLVGLVDIREEGLREAAGHVGLAPAQCFRTLEEALKQVEADAVLCVTPPDYHRATVVTALQAGLRVITEKPLAGTPEDCRAILLASAETGRTCTVSQNYRYLPAPWTMAALVRSGVIGEVGQIRVDFYKGVGFSGFRQEMDYPLLTDMSIHHFDILRFLTGSDAVAVSGQAWNPPWSHYRGDCSSSLVFKMGNGARAVYNASWCAQGDFCDWVGNWQIEGSKGTLVYRSGELELLTVGEGYQVRERKALPLTPPALQGQDYVLDDFLAVAERGERPATDVIDNIRSVSMVHAAVRAVQTGCEQPVLDAQTGALLKKCGA